MLFFLISVHLQIASILWIAGSARHVPVHSYDALYSNLVNGAEIRYFFNVSSCVQPDNGPAPYKDIPTFGGKIQYYSTTPNTADEKGQTFFDDSQYIDTDSPLTLGKELYTFWIENNTAKVFWAKPGLFENDTDSLSGLYCSWTEGQGKFWAIPHQRKRHLTSYDEVREMLFSGEEIRYQVNRTQCKCPDTSDQCTSGIAGGKINAFKQTKNGSLVFSSDSTTIFPIAWTYIRMVNLVHVHSNNTVSIRTAQFVPSTWEESTFDEMICPIHSGSISEGVKFFVNTI
uniref:Uncharacterized protein LOC111110378 n=1 Tax=Crassostrea virginica TaxID=6565 RepID=A0A8B8BIB9_CRAVI|nr:uncharacterized protein LOC111110378 [Crassostrea virginica]